MARLTVYDVTEPTVPDLSTTDRTVVAAHLAMAGVPFERWTPDHRIADMGDADAVLSAYAASIGRIQAERGFQSADVVHVPRGVAGAAELRAKFLDEHTHSEDEARFFVEGGGAFYLHLGRKVYRLVCEAGDLLSVPAGTPHWFDMGPDPHFTAIRLFTRPDGWVGYPTGDRIADRFPRYAPDTVLG